MPVIIGHIPGAPTDRGLESGVVVLVGRVELGGAGSEG